MNNILSVTYRTLLFYIIITVAYRLMGKREIGQLGIIDLIISILIAELVAISIENYNDSLFYTVIPIFILVLIEIILAKLSMKYKNIRLLLDGKPSLIIENGKLNYKEMVRLRYSIDDLLMQLRQNSIKSIEDIEYAFLEHNGKLSIFKYDNYNIKSDYPMPLIIDGEVNISTLNRIKKDKSWINNILNKRNIKIKEIIYAIYKNKTLYIIKKDDFKTLNN